MITSSAALGTEAVDQLLPTFQSPSPGLIQTTGPPGPTAGAQRSSSASSIGRRRVRTDMDGLSFGSGSSRPPLAAVELDVPFVRPQRPDRRVAPHRLRPERRPLLLGRQLHRPAEQGDGPLVVALPLGTGALLADLLSRL